MIRPRAYELSSWGVAYPPENFFCFRSIFTSPYWHFARSVSRDHFPTVNHLVNPVKRKYALVVLLNCCEVGSGFLEPIGQWSISFPTVAMTNGATVDILGLTDVDPLRVAEHGSGN